ncbi:NAD-dependent epimerase/dehydratase terH [Cladobotryum mycophilum]|uniref:NAD-dependent epimerase/dehydratase terH n=1 Tax=Cladobotryum mycophilum TaxID=491253 RepID=A0ABR0SIH2_9HYPO
MSEPTPSIPKGSWVLVTGATGYVGSQTVKQFLERGYKVRGTVRSLQKAAWLNKLFGSYGDSFELVEVTDFANDNAFGEAVKGVSAIAHIATITTFAADPNEVIPPTVAGTVSILKAALKEPSVKQIVYTSSIVAATPPIPGNDTRVDKDSWNEYAVKAAWAPPPYEPARGRLSYAASKVEAEKAFWKFAEENKPHFAINVVAPATIIGEPLDKSHIESSASWINLLYDGNVGMVAAFPAIFEIDVKDVALLHVASILDPDTSNARLQAWGRKANWNHVLREIRKLYPDHKVVDDFPGDPQLTITTDFSESFALLKKWGKQDGWKPFEQTVAENLKPIVEWDTKA